MRSKSDKIFLGAIMLLLASSCGNDNEPQVQTPDPDAGREQSVVDVNLSFGEVWDIHVDGTRAAPPTDVDKDDSYNDINEDSYIDIKKIKTVRIFTFRRKEGSDGEFFYDKKNDMILPVEKNPQTGKDTHSGHDHSIAKGKITKTYGYEYRVIAIAYPPECDSNLINAIGDKSKEYFDSWMHISYETYSGFCAKLETYNCSGWKDYLPESIGVNTYNTYHINNEILQTPQMFYGTLHSKYNDSDIIPYAEVDKDGNMDSKVGLTGILKRGVAKVTLNFLNTKNNYNNILDGTNYGDIQWITVLAETPYTKVSLRNYDDFLTPSDSINIKSDAIGHQNENTYTAVAYLPVSSINTEQPITFFILPCMTKLAIRVKTVKAETLNTHTYIRNGQLTGDGVEADGNNGTGIVSPDFIDNVFYFRRNHKYTITVKTSPYDIVKNHSLN